MEYLKIVLRSDLCAGNGESVGNTVDTDVCMDEAGLPYIPARRLKGCLRQAARDLAEMGYEDADRKMQSLFGDPYGNEGCLFIQDAVMKGAEALRIFLTKKIPADNRGTEPDMGQIPDAVKRMAHPANVERLFSEVRGQTSLEDGVKKDNSLRFTRVISHYDPFGLKEKKEMEFCAPVYLETEDEELSDFLKDCCKATRHIGTSRNRGLGNVTISVVEEKPQEDENSGSAGDIQNESTGWEKYREISERLQPEDKVKISYHITLDAPVTLPGCDELNTAIPARSVIGCLAGSYLQTESPEDETFCSLFQNGDVRWSALTPVINGVISDPAPMMLVKLKNDNGRMINHLVQEDTGWKGLKPKTMDSAFASLYDGGDSQLRYAVAEPSIHTVYHHAVNGTVQDQPASPDTAEGGGRMLYMQDSVEAGMIYGGTVICPVKLSGDVIRCLEKAKLRFGRSRSAQYAACSLKEITGVEPLTKDLLPTEKGEPVYVILRSDLAVQEEGRYITDAESIRRALAAELKVSEQMPQGRQDYCRYHTIGGYQTVWKLQKPHVPAVKAGSVYCFAAAGEPLPSEIQIGEFPQEGFGICCILPGRKMKELAQVEKGRIDHAEPEKQEEHIRNVYIKLLISAGIEAMRRYGLDYQAENKDIPAGRLRRMLSQAKDYQDLLRMIAAIKESDRSSENETGRKKDSEDLVKDIYSEKDSSGLSLGKILGLEEGLWEEVQHFREAEEALLSEWKIPLEIVLRRQHYEKER